MSNFDLIIFDCDGVLVDSEVSTNTVLRDMLNERGGKISLAETMALFMGHSVGDSYTRIESVTGAPTDDQFYEEFLVRRDDALRNTVEPIPYIVETLPKLPLPYAVASGAEIAKMRLTLGRTGMLKQFEGRMFGKDMVAKSKPAPDVYLLAAKTLGVAPARCVVVEDTPSGTTAGVAAGMTVFGYCAKNAPDTLFAAGASAVFKDMRQLPMLLRP
jgi:HAD superfamily hydrolase (TIGR01509 family)